MVTQKSIDIFAGYVTWGNIWGAVPFTWDGATKSGKYLSYTSSKWLRVKWWIFVAYGYFIFIYHIGRGAYETKYGDIVTLFKCCIYILGHAIVVISINVVIFKSTELEFIVNSCIHTSTLLRKKYLKKVYQQHHPLVEICLVLGYLVALTYPIPIGTAIFVIPQDQLFLSGLIKSGQLTVHNFLPLAILHILFAFTAFSLAMFLVAVSIIVCPNATLLCEEISLSRRSYKSVEEIRNLESIMVVYRAMQVYTVEANELVSAMLLAMQFVFKRQIYVGNVAILFMADRLHLLMRLGFVIWTLLLMSVWGAVLVTTSMPYDTTKECLKTWKYSIPPHWSSRDKQLFAKFRKSCWPVKLRIGNFSFVQKDKLMKFFYSVSKGTMEALLTYQKA